MREHCILRHGQEVISPLDLRWFLPFGQSVQLMLSCSESLVAVQEGGDENEASKQQGRHKVV
jgi:hypothetical protein